MSRFVSTTISKQALLLWEQVEFDARSGLLVVCNPQTLARDHVSWLLGFKKVPHRRIFRSKLQFRSVAIRQSDSLTCWILGFPVRLPWLYWSRWRGLWLLALNVEILKNTRIVSYYSFLCLPRIVEEVLVSLSQGRVGKPEAENHNGKVSSNNDRIW